MIVAAVSNNFYNKLWLLLLLFWGLLWPISSRAASFNCSHARSTLEVLICADAELSSLDGQVGETYSKLRSSVPPVSKEKAEVLDGQREFLKKRTEVCPLPSSPEMITCLERFYSLRLNALQKQVAVLGNQNAQVNRPPRRANGSQGQTESDGEEADVPSDLVANLKKDWDVPSDFDSDCSDGLRECVHATWFDLNVCDVMHDQQVSTKRLPSSANRPQQAALLVEPSNGGNDNWTHLLYIRAGNGWRKIFDDDCHDSLIRRCTSKHGLPDLEVWHHASASEGDQVVYQFDGNEYKEIACNDVNDESPDGESYSEPRSTPCEVPSDFLATFQNDLEHTKDLEHAKSCLEGNRLPLKENVRVEWFDLNQFDLNQPHLALIVRGLHQCASGNDAEMFLYVPAGKAWRQILHTRGDSLMVCRQSDAWCPGTSGSERRSISTHRWPDLAVGRPSATVRRIVGFQFDGKVYKATVCNDLDGTQSPCPASWRASE